MTIKSDCERTICLDRFSSFPENCLNSIWDIAKIGGHACINVMQFFRKLDLFLTDLLECCPDGSSARKIPNLKVT